MTDRIPPSDEVLRWLADEQRGQDLRNGAYPRIIIQLVLDGKLNKQWLRKLL